MMYIAPLFALSGLYWQFGLVMYWVTTNLWTLGQQYVLFRNFTPITAGADADSATAPAAKGTPGPAGTTVSKGATARGASARGTAGKATPARTAAAKSGAAKSGSAKTGAAKGGAARTGSAKTAASPTTAKAGTKVNGQSSNGQSSSGESNGGQRSSSQRGASQRTATAARPQAAKSTSGQPAETSNGTERRGLSRLVRSNKPEPEPEPEPEVPATKLVRQQPVRQSRSKRSGKH
jgi:hypothetical protein